MLSKKNIILTSVTALGAALLVLGPATLRSETGAGCPCSWYQAVPDPEWGLTGTLGDLLPVNYYDVETAGAYFLAPLAGLQSLLPTQLNAMDASATGSPWSGLVPPGYGVICAYFAEYNSVQNFAPYNEAILCIMVSDPIEGFPAWHVVSITVTTPDSQWGGIEAYGLPKVVGAVHIQSVKPKGLKCHDSVDNGLIMKLELPTEDMVAMAPSPIFMVCIKDGYYVRAPFVLTGTQYMSFGVGTSAIKLGENDPVARQLRAIGLEMCPSIGAFHGVHLQGTLYAGSCSLLP